MYVDEKILRAVKGKINREARDSGYDTAELVPWLVRRGHSDAVARAAVDRVVSGWNTRPVRGGR